MIRAKIQTNESVGKIIHGLRQSKGYTLRQLADMSGLSESGISRYESDQRTPTIGAFAKILEALDAELYIIHN